ncbi:hypothetical protein GE061_013978 [Apolygus lucorum]|uniref:THAP-type domain-containing protein n=1 Tax=Apolygus lucorum TaxID=248454 RepID=A0A8S9XPK2_APOLU|nr:hypothetical protein GE061_013978 [Apolygus lucorum]
MKSWKKIVGIEDESIIYFYICGRHFAKSSFRTFKRDTLLRQAVPCFRTGPLNPLTGDYSPFEQNESLPLESPQGFLPPAQEMVAESSSLLQISSSPRIHQSGTHQNDGLPSSSENLVVDSAIVGIEVDNLPGSTIETSGVEHVKSPILVLLDDTDGNSYSYHLDVEGLGSSFDVSGVQHLSEDILTRVDVTRSSLTGVSGSVWNEVVEEVPNTMTVHSRPLSSSTPLRPTSTAKKLDFGSALITPGATSDVTSTLASMSESDVPLPQGCKGKPASHGNSILSLIGETRYSSLTPRKQKLVQEVRKQRKSLGVIKKSLKSKSLRLQSLEKNNLDDIALVERFASSMSAPVANLVYAQVRNFKRKPRARRWTVAEKLIALSLYKRAPRSYRFLATMFTLPTPRTLVTLLNKVPLKPGVNSHVFDSIKNAIDKCDDSRYAYCALLWDEMSIRENLEYIPSDDLIWGFEDLGDGKRSAKPAHHALVFMAVGLFYSWKQPLAYYFTPSNLGGVSLIEILRSVLSHCNSAGLIVRATICDGHSVNRKVYQLLGSSSHQPWFTCDGNKIFTLFDPPHLLKCTRNMFVKHDLSIETDIYLNGKKAVMTAKWRDIVETFEDDSKNLTRAMHKITEDHLNPKLQKSMKVNLAAQIFSRTVTATIETCFTSAIKTCLVNKLADDDLGKGNCERNVEPQEILESLQRFLVQSAEPEGREPVSEPTSPLPKSYSDSFTVPKQVNVRQDSTGHRGISCAYVCGFSGLKIAHEVLERESYSCNIQQRIMVVLAEKLDFAWWQNHCPEHSTFVFNAITVSLCRIYIPWWCGARRCFCACARSGGATGGAAGVDWAKLDLGTGGATGADWAKLGPGTGGAAGVEAADLARALLSGERLTVILRGGTQGLHPSLRYLNKDLVADPNCWRWIVVLLTQGYGDHPSLVLKEGILKCPLMKLLDLMEMVEEEPLVGALLQKTEGMVVDFRNVQLD